MSFNAICPGFIESDRGEERQVQVAKSTGTRGEEMVKASWSRAPLGRVLARSKSCGRKSPLCGHLDCRLVRLLSAVYAALSTDI